jgi:hypothetical protein
MGELGWKTIDWFQDFPFSWKIEVDKRGSDLAPQALP